MAQTIYEALEILAFFCFLVGLIMALMLVVGQHDITVWYSFYAALPVSLTLLLFNLPTETE